MSYRKSTNIEFIVITMLILSTLGVIQLWMWTHYEIHIQEDKFVYCNLFSGKHIIEFNEIDIKNSKYLFVYHKGKEILDMKF